MSKKTAPKKPQEIEESAMKDQSKLPERDLFFWDEITNPYYQVNRHLASFFARSLLENKQSKPKKWFISFRPVFTKDSPSAEYQWQNYWLNWFDFKQTYHSGKYLSTIPVSTEEAIKRIDWLLAEAKRTNRLELAQFSMQSVFFHPDLEKWVYPLQFSNAKVNTGATPRLLLLLSLYKEQAQRFLKTGIMVDRRDIYYRLKASPPPEILCYYKKKGYQYKYLSDCDTLEAGLRIEREVFGITAAEEGKIVGPKGTYFDSYIRGRHDLSAEVAFQHDIADYRTEIIAPERFNKIVYVEKRAAYSHFLTPKTVSENFMEFLDLTGSFFVFSRGNPQRDKTKFFAKMMKHGYNTFFFCDGDAAGQYMIFTQKYNSKSSSYLSEDNFCSHAVSLGLFASVAEDLELGENPDIEKLESGKEEVLRTVAELTGFEIANVRKMLDDKKQFEINAFSGVNLPERAAQIYMIETWRHEGESARKFEDSKNRLKEKTEDLEDLKTIMEEKIQEAVSDEFKSKFEEHLENTPVPIYNIMIDEIDEEISRLHRIKWKIEDKKEEVTNKEKRNTLEPKSNDLIEELTDQLDNIIEDSLDDDLEGIDEEMLDRHVDHYFSENLKADSGDALIQIWNDNFQEETDVSIVLDDKPLEECQIEDSEIIAKRYFTDLEDIVEPDIWTAIEKELKLDLGFAEKVRTVLQNNRPKLSTEGKASEL